jgi:hypothetical protein
VERFGVAKRVTDDAAHVQSKFLLRKVSTIASKGKNDRQMKSEVTRKAIVLLQPNQDAAVGFVPA